MYGLINRAIKEHVLDATDELTWNEVRKKAGLDDDSFVAMDRYDDEVTYDLVDAAGEVLGAPTEDILRGFGRYWVLYTGAEGWGPMLDLMGSTVIDMLSNLDDMHHRLRTTMPSMVMPQFRVLSASPNEIVFNYISTREGLAPMVLGIMHGLNERCGEDWTVTQTGFRVDNGFDTFTLTTATTQ